MKNKFSGLSFISGVLGIIFSTIFLIINKTLLPYFPSVSYILLVLSFIFGLFAIISGIIGIREKDNKNGLILGIVGLIGGLIIVSYFLYLNILINSAPHLCGM